MYEIDWVLFSFELNLINNILLILGNINYVFWSCRSFLKSIVFIAQKIIFKKVYQSKICPYIKLGHETSFGFTRHQNGHLEKLNRDFFLPIDYIIWLFIYLIYVIHFHKDSLTCNEYRIKGLVFVFVFYFMFNKSYNRNVIPFKIHSSKRNFHCQKQFYRSSSVSNFISHFCLHCIYGLETGSF